MEGIEGGCGMLLALACTKCVAACSCPEGIYRLLSQVAATAVSYLIARGHKWGVTRGGGRQRRRRAPLRCVESTRAVAGVCGVGCVCVCVCVCALTQDVCVCVCVCVCVLCLSL